MLARLNRTQWSTVLVEKLLEHSALVNGNCFSFKIFSYFTLLTKWFTFIHTLLLG